MLNEQDSAMISCTLGTVSHLTSQLMPSSLYCILLKDRVRISLPNGMQVTELVSWHANGTCQPAALGLMVLLSLSCDGKRMKSLCSEAWKAGRGQLDLPGVDDAADTLGKGPRLQVRWRQEGYLDVAERLFFFFWSWGLG